MSFISAATRVAARAGGRVIGLGAVGAGGAAYVGSQVDDLKNNVIGTISTAYDRTTSTIKQLGDSAGQTIGHITNGASTTYSNVSSSIEDKLEDFLSNLGDFLNANSNPRGGPESDDQDDHRFRRGLSGVSAVGLAASLDEDRDNSSQKDQATSGLMHLTRKLIEIRSLLMSIDKDESLVLPSIVVIGSQSSGKSSVLEAIVGHEFLPKGNNMVTRRPLELTLIHTPQTPSNPNVKDYVECPQFGPGQFEDFREVQRRLTRLNQEVPDSIAVNDQPIHLRVYSPNVPDLTLIDLPGYVQISSMDQPEELREKISQLCDKYIRKPNIILSVCAADVDLANSPALRASKRVDPHGYRTIGVITKLDLVDPSIGAAILANDKYRLALGYVGVICRQPNSSGSSFVESRLLRRNPAGNPAQLSLSKSEFDFFRSHADHYDQPNLLLGTETLKQRLMKVLEESMSSSLHDISNRVSLELEEASYQYKVQYNDRNVSAETYVAESMDLVKRRLNEFSRMLVKPEVRGLLKHELEQKVLGLLAEIYWSDRRITELGKLGDSKLGPEGLDHYWIHKLEAAQSRLTKGGVGRSSAELVADEIRSAVARLLEHQPMTYHIETCDEIREITEDILEGLRARAADHVEIAVMPYRYEIEMDKTSWENGRTRSIKLMEEEIKLCDHFLKSEKTELKKNWRLREALERIEQDEVKMRKLAQRKLLGINNQPQHSTQPNDSDTQSLIEEAEDTRPPPVLLDRARRLRDMEIRSEILRLRLLALKSKRCKLSSSATSVGLMGGGRFPSSDGSTALAKNEHLNTLLTQMFCPEVFLNILADRLASTATDFINIDLLHRFFSSFPHELNSRLVKKLEGDEALRFARENFEVRNQIELQDRKEKLEAVMRELVTLAYMKQSNSLLSHSDENENDHNGKGKRRHGGGTNNHSSGKNYFSRLF